MRRSRRNVGACSLPDLIEELAGRVGLVAFVAHTLLAAEQIGVEGEGVVRRFRDTWTIPIANRFSGVRVEIVLARQVPRAQSRIEDWWTLKQPAACRPGRRARP